MASMTRTTGKPAKPVIDGTNTDNTNVAPVITSGGGASSTSVNVAENSATVMKILASDANTGSKLTYSISGGADAAKFSIDSATGALRFIAPPDFETRADTGQDNIYNVVVKVSDGSLTDTQSISVKILNLNEAPVIISGGGGASSAITIAENAAAVTALAAKDPDAGSILSYSIVGGADATKFVIDAATGMLRFATAQNFEAPTDSGGNNVYDVTVKVSDGTMSDTQSIAVTVANVNEAPVITSGGAAVSTTISVAENSASVTTVAAADVDAGSALTYSISGGADAAKFTIDSATGVLRFAAAPDFESPADSGKNNVYDVTVKVSDGTMSDTQAIAVKVTDVAGDSASNNPPPTGSGTIITVSNAAELLAAMKSATGGETIQLNEGNYGELRLTSASGMPTYNAQVTITSADPSNLAVFDKVNLSGLGNLKFDSVVFDYKAAEGASLSETPFKFQSCSNITISNVNFDGDLASGVSAVDDGFGTGRALVVLQSEQIVVDNNTFTNWFRAGAFGSVTGLEVTNNEVSGNSSDGFDFANIDNVLIDGNHLHDFRLSPDSSAHPDMIQFWTAGTTSPSTNITITNNFLDMGSGVSTQSIFMRNELVDQGLAGPEMFYQNVTISNNVIANLHAHGITVGATDGLVIDNNTVIQKVDPTNSEGASVPSINVSADSVHVTVTDNIAPAFNGNVTNPPPEWTVGNNVVVQSTDPMSGNYVGNLYSDALDTTSSTLIDYQIIPGTSIDGQGAGSTLSPALASGELTGYVQAHSDNHGEFMVQHFDASAVFSATGKVDTAGATVVWDFGDGTTGTGLAVDHVYAQPGIYEAKATVTLPTNATVHIDKTVAVVSDHLLSLDFEHSAADESPLVNASDLGLATFEAGKDGEALRLNGGTVKYDATSDFFGNTDFTVLADFKKDGATPGTGGKLLYFSKMMYVTIGADGVEATIGTSNGPVVLTAAKIGINDADWHKLALTFSSETGTASLYVDGHVVSTVTGLQGVSQNGVSSSNLLLGDPSGDSFVGLIDNVHYVREALTPSQVQAPDPIAAWNMSALGSDTTVATFVAEHPDYVTHVDSGILATGAADPQFSLV